MCGGFGIFAGVKAADEEVTVLFHFLMEGGGVVEERGGVGEFEDVVSEVEAVLAEVKRRVCWDFVCGCHRVVLQVHLG